MNYLEPLKMNEIDLNKIYYSKIKEFQNKKIIIIKYLINSNNNNFNKFINFVFQTPTLTNIYNPVIYNNYAELDILLESKSGNISNFINFLDKLELKIKNDAKIYASRWFIKKNSQDHINFQKIIKDNNTIKIKLIKNNDFETIAQMNNEKQINFNLIPENSWCKIILEFYAIWINSNNDFGLIFRPILISFKLKNIYNYKFLKNDSESESQYNITDIEEKKSNIFLKSKTNSNNNKNNETSQLECNILYNTLVEQIISKPTIENNNNEITSDNNLSILNASESKSSNSSEIKNIESSISSLESLKSTDSSN